MRRQRLSFLSIYLVIYLIFLYAPILVIPIFSFNSAAAPTLPLSGFTLKWHEMVWGNAQMMQAALNSVFVGLSVSVLTTMLGVLAARALTRHRFPGKKAASGLIMAPLFLPEIIVAVSLLTIILSLGLSASLVAVIFGHTVFCLPYAMSVLTAGFQNFDPSLEEASRDLGETAFGTFRRVILPVVSPAILSSLLVSFTISFDEFILAFFLSGSEPTLPVYIWGQLRFAARLPSVLALGSIILVLSIALLAIAEFLNQRAEERLTAMGAP